MSNRRSQKRARDSAKAKLTEYMASLPRCPVCENQITELDFARFEGAPVHKRCLERIKDANKIAAGQRMAEAGVWLPGQQ